MSTSFRALGRVFLPIFDVVTRRHVLLKEIRDLQERVQRIEADQARLLKRLDVTLAIYEQRMDNIHKKVSEFVSKSG